MSVLKRARAVAVAAHGDAKYGNLPYVAHLDEVVALLKAHGVEDEEVLAAGYLHDSIEDTDLSFAEISAEFGSEVALMVGLVSKPPMSDAESYFRFMAHHPDAVAIKLADRIANWSGAKDKGLKRLLAKYEREYPVLLAALHRPGLYPSLFAKLAEVAA